MIDWLKRLWFWLVRLLTGKVVSRSGGVGFRSEKNPWLKRILKLLAWVLGITFLAFLIYLILIGIIYVLPTSVAYVFSGLLVIGAAFLSGYFIGYNHGWNENNKR